uniref:Vitellogenin receptor n=1 Tax=Cacopsylla melanoneura TaxID=428564 RepID=A0A8D8TIU5_9HEMI
MNDYLLYQNLFFSLFTFPAPKDVMEDCLASNEKFKCHDNLKCITFDKLCDAHSDCNDGSDESAQCTTACPSSCQFKCKQTPSGPLCYCPPGTHTSTLNNASSCVDIDECIHFGICDQTCTNTYGSYVCSCEHGFELQSDGKTCRVKDGNDAVLYFSTYDEVRTINLNSGLETPVATGLKHVAGVACDGRSLYWSSIYEGEETIIKSKLDGTGKELVVSAGN